MSLLMLSIFVAAALLLMGGGALAAVAIMRRDLMVAKAETAAILDAAVDGIITIDSMGHIQNFNPAAERLFGYAGDEVHGRNIKMLMPQPYRAEHDSYIAAYKSTGKAKIIGIGREVQGRRKDGSVFPMELSVGETIVNGRRLFAGIVRDITDRKRAEADLRAAKNEAERASLAKSKFLAAASHDLRQPVQALVFFAATLETRVIDGMAATILGDMRGSIDSLNVLLESLLDVSRLDAGLISPRMVNFSLSTLTERLVAEITPLAKDKGLTVRAVGSSAVIRSDPVLLGRVLQNLLANAVRYTRNGAILVGCRRKGSSVAIEIWDTGIGIPGDRLEDVFQEFVQIGNSERDRSQGLGLGLAIVNRLGKLLGHPLNVRSVEGRGSVFSIQVPVTHFSASCNVAPLDQGTRLAGAGSGTIFVIDDEASVLRSLRLILEAWGYDVLTAQSEEEVVEILRDCPVPPNLIVADYRLREGTTGAQVIQRIRKQFQAPIPSVIITGDTAPERLREAEAHGLDLLHKPVQPTELRRIVSREMRHA